MGLDAQIEIRGLRNAIVLGELNTRIKWVLDAQSDTINYANFFAFTSGDKATFETYWRYWAPGYERGPWFNIYGVITTAMEMTGLEVRYGSDHDKELAVMTPKLLSEYWSHFCGPHGNDYRSALYQQR